MKLTKSWVITIASFIFAIAAPPLADAGILISEEQITHYMMLFFGVSGVGGVMSVKKNIKDRDEKKFQAQAAALKTIPPNAKVEDGKLKITNSDGTEEEYALGKLDPKAPDLTYDKGVFTASEKTGEKRIYSEKGKLITQFDKDGNEMPLEKIPDIEMPQKPLQTDQATNPKYTNEGWFQTDLEFVKGTGAVMRRDDPFLWIKVPDAVYIKGGVYQGTDLKDPDTRLVQIDSNTGDSLRFEMYDKAAGNLVPLPPGKYMFRFAATYDMKGLPKAGDGVFTIV